MSLQAIFELPDSISRIKLVTKAGDTLLEEDVIYLDGLLVDAQTATSKQMSHWLPYYTEAINQKYNCNLPPTEIFFLAGKVCSLMAELKKSFDDTLMLQEYTDSTPSNSQTQNSESSTSGFQESMPEENFFRDEQPIQ